MTFEVGVAEDQGCAKSHDREGVELGIGPPGPLPDGRGSLK
jgi:hypothetical protein